MKVSMDEEYEQIIRSLEGNNECIDCKAESPDWASVSFGVLMCLECSGRHRGLGVHISFVRSITMDAWAQDQICLMMKGGNKNLCNFFTLYNVPLNAPIVGKYNTQEAAYYRNWLLAVSEDREPPPRPAIRSSNIIQTEITNFQQVQEKMLDDRMQQTEMKSRMKSGIGSHEFGFENDYFSSIEAEFRDFTRKTVAILNDVFSAFSSNPESVVVPRQSISTNKFDDNNKSPPYSFGIQPITSDYSPNFANLSYPSNSFNSFTPSPRSTKLSDNETSNSYNHFNIRRSSSLTHNSGSSPL